MNWDLAGVRDIGELTDFLSKNENSCINITGRLLHDGRLLIPDVDRTLLLIRKDHQIINGCCLISKSGQVFPYVYFDDFESSRQLAEIVSGYCPSIFSIMGSEKTAGDLADALAIKSCEERKYFLMKLDKTLFPTKKVRIFSNVTVRKAIRKDFSAVLDLHYNYLREEVDLDKPTTMENAQKITEDLLDSEIVYLCEMNGLPASKANTNLKGINYYQVGGIYTKKEFRGKRLAYFTLEALIRHILKIDKEVILFVKKSNLPAINLYSKLGFKYFENFSIIYF